MAFAKRRHELSQKCGNEFDGENLAFFCQETPRGMATSVRHSKQKSARLVKTAVLLLMLLASLSWPGSTGNHSPTVTKSGIFANAIGFYDLDWTSECEQYECNCDDEWNDCNDDGLCESYDQCYACQYIEDGDGSTWRICHQSLVYGESDVECDNYYDPQCAYNYFWRGSFGNDGYGGDPTTLVLHYTQVYIEAYDPTIVHDCDNMTYYQQDGYFQYVYACIFNQELWTSHWIPGETEDVSNDFKDYNDWVEWWDWQAECDDLTDSDEDEEACDVCLAEVADRNLHLYYNPTYDESGCIEGTTCCDSNCYRHISNWAHWNPCIEEYESGICARCKFGMARIVNIDGIFCGYISDVVEVDAGWYETGYDDYGDEYEEWVENIIIIDEPCEIDYYYEAFHDYNRTKYTHSMTNRYQNHTTGYTETLCVQTSFDSDATFDLLTNCTDVGKVSYRNDSLWEDSLSSDQRDRAIITIGCMQCEEDSAIFSERVDAYGIYYQFCRYTADASEENDLCGIGQIMQWVGIIESERVLTCVTCSSLIPACLSCSSAQKCDMCQANYLKAEIVDSFGNKNVVCIEDFCGFYGEGSGCAGVVGIEGCDRSSSNLVDKVWVESCIRCAPGYQRYRPDNAHPTYLCMAAAGKLFQEIFVAPFDSKTLDVDQLDQLSPQFDFEQNIEDWKGFSVRNPFYSLQNAFYLMQGEDSPMIQYKEIMVTTYLMKGTHHFVKCVNEDEVDFENIGAWWEEDEELELLSLLCFQQVMDYDFQLNCQDSACSRFTEIYPFMTQQPVVVDNMIVNIKALDCALEHTVFAKKMSDSDKEILRDTCVDVAAGEKVQIRIPNTYTNFNITNHWTFENIEFTGEDLFAEAKLDNATMGYMDEQGILAFMPFTKCTVREDPAKLTTIDEITMQKEDFVKAYTWTEEYRDAYDEFGEPIMEYDEETYEFVQAQESYYVVDSVIDFDYECVNDFNRTAVEPPDAIDERCNPPDYDATVSPNSANCRGEPYHDSFFEYSEANSLFTKRHKVLFNLYAFDSTRTQLTSPPTLEIVNCTFKYFVNKLDALIQVETNNLGFFGEIETDDEGTEVDERFLSYYGEDRGAMVTIENSQFLSNSFVKGIIYYNRFESISYDEAPQFMNFTANFQGDRTVNYDEISEDYIRIIDSTFHNNAFHTVIQALSLESDDTSTNTVESFLDEIDFRKFREQGMILNTNGYSGAIEVANSTFTSNIAYIQQILIYESLSSDEYFDFNDQEMFIQFSDDANTYLQFKKCVDQEWTGRYLFREVIDPNGEFDDALVISQLENVSPFMIRGNRGPIIFSGNTFKDNIGTTGGAIHIEDPDFRYGDNPSIVMVDNKFENNMAYWAGNAFHIQMKMRMIHNGIDDPTYTSDAWQTCGSGILIDSNYFYGNIGLKKHNGGVGVIRCQHYTETAEGQFTFLSGKLRDVTYETDTKGVTAVVALDDPSTHKSYLQDLFDENKQYELLTYGTYIVNNTFANNYTGKRGSALLIELISELKIIENKFMSNGPVHTYTEIEHSPYYKNFLYNKRTLSYYLLGVQLLGDCKDEFSWFNRCHREGYEIDMPQLQGAIYLLNCHQLDTCWLIGSLPSVITFTEYQKFHHPWESVQIDQNYFYDNQANIVMFSTQTQAQASSIYINGGANNTISGNEFSGHRNWAESYMKLFAFDVWRYLPKNYFKYSQAVIMRVDYPFNVYATQFTLSVPDGDQTIQTLVSNNTIADNMNMQVVTYSSLRYAASILEFNCHLLNATLALQGNEITRNQFIGTDSTFFHINGGIALVEDNNFSYNGILTSNQINQSVENYKRQYPSSVFPWEDYEFAEAQEKGMFTFVFNNFEMQIGTAHKFRNNTFEHIYCQLGCAYYVSGTEIQQFVFTDNTYYVMVATRGSAVFYGTLELQQSNALAQVWIQSYRNERFEVIFGGSIQLEGNNVPMTFIDNSKFIDNYGNQGAAINFNKGGGLYISDSEFYFTLQDEYMRIQIDNAEDSETLVYLLGQLKDVEYQSIYKTYNSRLDQNLIFEREVFDNVIMNIQAFYGQIYLLNTWKTVLNKDHPVVAFGSQSLDSLVSSIHALDVSDSASQYSSIKDSAFIQNLGIFCSSIFIDTSYLQLLGSKEMVNFSLNVAPQGPTILAKSSYIISKSMHFQKNKGNQGACFQIDSFSELIDKDSKYILNEAEQGGVIFAINDSTFTFTGGLFSENYADESGAVLYAMYNSDPRALSFENCVFTLNFARQNLIQLMSSEAYIYQSYFEDNSAKIVNHGITMITSNLEFVNSTVTFTDEFAESLTAAKLSQLDTGFFSLFLSSTIHIRDDSQISNLKALNQAVLSAQSMSSVFVSNEVYFVNNLSTNSAGQTFSLQNTDEAEIEGAHFKGNSQINVLIELGKLDVNNSEFTDGKVNHIKGVDSIVRLSKVNVHDSESKDSGHGFFCSRCWFASVEDSTFENLNSTSIFGTAGAIKLENLKNVTFQPISYIKNTEFIGNRAASGGALHLDKTHLLEVSGNTFIENEAQGANGGAVLYTCDPTSVDYTCTVALLGNAFVENKAERKGGALRYENANFTDRRLIYETQSSETTEVRRRLQRNSLSDVSTLAETERVNQDWFLAALSQEEPGNQFTDNEAAYGNDLASFPSYIEYIVPANLIGAEIDQNTKKISIAAGQEFEIDLQIRDQEGREYTDENSGIAKVVFEKGQDLGTQALMVGSDAVAKNGKFVFNTFKVRIKPDTSANITFQFQKLEHYGTAIEFLDVNPVFTVTARKCMEGEQYTEDLSCKPCPASQYLYEPQLEPGVCKDCSPHAFCYGMNITAPRPGYWRSHATGEEFTPCNRPESCLGGNETDPIGQCAEGYTGILCADCAPGYSGSGLTCSQCPEVVLNILIFSGILLMLIFLIAFMVRSTLGGVETKKPLYQVLLKIFLNHFQILSAVSQIDFKWPDIIQTVLASQQGIADGPSQVLSVDCIIMDMFPDSKPSFRLNYVRLILFTCMPFLIFAISMLFWAIYGRCKNILKQERDDKGTATAIIVLFLFYPTIVTIIAKSANCVVIEGVSRLYDDLEEECYTGTHLLMILTVSLPGGVAWVLGIPLFALRKLYSNMAALLKIKEFSAGKQHEDLLRRFKVRLGFLTAGYDDRFFFWEIWLLGRKSLLVMMIVFLSSVSSGVQSLTSILVLMIFFMIQWRYQPYYDPALNAMEELSLGVIILTIYSGLYYQAGEGDAFMESQPVTWLIFGAVLIPSLAFSVSFGRKMWIEILKVVAGKSAKCFRFITFGLKDLVEFRMQYMDDDVSEEEDKAEHELKEDVPKAANLQGFRQDEQNHATDRLKEVIDKARQRQNNSHVSQQSNSGSINESIDAADQFNQVEFQAASQVGSSSESQSEASNYDQTQVQPGFQRRKALLIGQSDRRLNDMTGDLSISDVSGIQGKMSKAEDPFGLNSTTQKQNFEYKDEVQFRGEKVIPGARRSQYLVMDDDDDEFLHQNQAKDRFKGGRNESLGRDAMNTSGELDKSQSFLGLGHYLAKIKSFKQVGEQEDGQDPLAQSRNSQQMIRNATQKVSGVTLQTTSKDEIEAKTQQQAQLRLSKVATTPAAQVLASAQQQVQQMRKQEESSGADSSGINSSLSDFNEDNLESAQKQISSQNAEEGKNFQAPSSVNIFKKQNQAAQRQNGQRDLSLSQSKPEGGRIVVMEQEVVDDDAPSAGVSHGGTSRRQQLSKRRKSSRSIEEEHSNGDDEFFFSDEDEGIAGKSIRGNTQRLPQQQQPRTNRSKRSQREMDIDTRQQVVVEHVVGKKGDDLSVASVSKIGKSTHRVKSSRRDANDFDDFLSDEEGGMDMTIRGNTQRNPKQKVAESARGKTNRTEKSADRRKRAAEMAVIEHSNDAAAGLQKMKKVSVHSMRQANEESIPDEPDDYDDFMSGDEEGKAVATIRGNTQRAPVAKVEEENKTVPAVLSNIVFYSRKIEPLDIKTGASGSSDTVKEQGPNAGSAAAGEADGEAKPIVSKAQKRKRKRNNKKKAKNEQDLNIFKNGAGQSDNRQVGGRSARKNNLDQQLMDLKLESKRKEEKKQRGGSSSDSSLDFI